MRKVRGVALTFVALFLLTGQFARTEELATKQITALVEPIALYPDTLLRQMLPAATFPDQIADAALLVQDKTDAEQIKEQNWDESVKIMATYPSILRMMYEKLDWTTDLGNAFLNQHEDVLKKIQELRAKAKEKGNLKSTEQQTVATKKSQSGDSYITIEQSNPEVVYVPQETGSAVYTEHVDTTDWLVPVATFGLGMALGSAWNDEHDDYYYGGPWGGPMWTSSDSFDHWVDARHDAYEDFRGGAESRQDFRQGQRTDRQDYRQEWAENNPDQVNQRRQDFQKNQNQRRQDFSGQRQNAPPQRDDLSAQRAEREQKVSPGREQKLSDARAGMKAQGFSENRGGARDQIAQPRASTAGSASWSGGGGNAFASRASNRGSLSRNSFGGGRPGGGGMRGGGRGGRR